MSLRDEPSSQLSKAERVAIELGVPDSGTPWIDDMIRKSNRRRMSECVATGMVTSMKRHELESPQVVSGLVDNLNYVVDSILAEQATR